MTLSLKPYFFSSTCFRIIVNYFFSSLSCLQVLLCRKITFDLVPQTIFFFFYMLPHHSKLFIQHSLSCLQVLLCRKIKFNNILHCVLSGAHKGKECSTPMHVMEISKCKLCHALRVEHVRLTVFCDFQAVCCELWGVL